MYTVLKIRLLKQCCWVSCALVALCVAACEREQPPLRKPPTATAEPEILKFPAEMYADDPEVNAFIRVVIGACAAGDYDAFRRLWSVRDDPFPRERFYRAWRSVKRVEIRGLKPVRHPETKEILYAVRAHVELDPEVGKPARDVTMLLIQERGQWRLTTPPKSLPDGLFDEPAPTSQPQTTTAPAAD